MRAIKGNCWRTQQVAILPYREINLVGVTHKAGGIRTHLVTDCNIVPDSKWRARSLS